MGRRAKKSPAFPESPIRQRATESMRWRLQTKCCQRSCNCWSPWSVQVCFTHCSLLSEPRFCGCCWPIKIRNCMCESCLDWVFFHCELFRTNWPSSELRAWFWAAPMDITGSTGLIEGTHSTHVCDGLSSLLSPTQNRRLRSGKGDVANAHATWRFYAVKLLFR